MGKRKIYKPGQLVTIDNELFRIKKSTKRRVGVCHLCDLATKKQCPAGSLCHKYCYRRQYIYLPIQYYLERVKLNRLCQWY